MDKLFTKETTYFGYTKVTSHEKTLMVNDVFRSVAHRYDLMNDLMSFGLHRLWKRFTIRRSQARAGQIILDIAGGTGDLTLALAKKIAPRGKVILADINEQMLYYGRERLLNQGITNNITYVQANAECLPFSENLFDCITIAFGLRNVTDQTAALHSMYRVLKPGGKLLILEFSKPLLPFLYSIYDAYSFKIIPKLGGWICNDEKSYQYLVESIRMHPDQETLKRNLEGCHFEDVNYHNLTGGIVALHEGLKY